MKFKTTLVLLGVFAILLALVLFFDSRAEKKQAAEEKSNTLISLAAADIRKVSLVRGLETLTFERDGAGPWRMISPLQAAADEYEVNGLVDNLASLRIERVVEKEAADPSVYEIPKTEVSIWVKDREAPVRLLVGMENPLDKSLFAKRDDDRRVVLLAATLKTALDKPIFDFRQKDVFKFAAADVKEIRVRARDVAWQAARDGDRWLLKAPVAALAAKGKIDSLLDSLSGLRAKAFVAETKSPEVLKSFGLDKPGYEVGLALPSVNQEIVFGLHQSGESFYATTSQSTKIITFEGGLLADLDRKAEDMRERKIADFYSWNADRLALKRDGTEIAVIKDRAGEKETWVFDEAAREEADRSLVEEFIRAVEPLEALAFIDAPGPLAAYGLDPGAEIRVRVKDSQDKTTETVLLVGREDTEKKEVVVKSPGLDYLFRVNSGFLQSWPKDKKAWQAAKPGPEESKSDKK